MADLAQVLRLGGAAYLHDHTLNTAQARAWRAICACRTVALGGQQLVCAACGHQHWHYHSCRNRHCPQCGARAKDRWLRGRLAEVLDVPYVHLVFTLPHELNSLYRADPRWLIQTLFASVAGTLDDLAAQARWMGTTGGQPAFSLVLHTWSQDLRQHLHLHAVMACGVLGTHGQWHVPPRAPDFLFPVRALSGVFRGKFMQALRRRAGQIDASQGDANLSEAGRKALYRHAWVVYAKAPLGGPAQVLDYLSRYSHRTAIGNERIQAVSAQEVCFSVRADDQGGKRRMRLPITEFIRRFLQHVLPDGVQRIRHYGVLANGCKKTQLAQAREALQQPAPNPLALESAQAFMARVAQTQIHTCPACHGPLHVAQTLAGLRHLPPPGQAMVQPLTPPARAPP
ncbi:MAG: IS91 family transposase [Burkholderiales bacterium]|nr:IS91 family transposase [Burkholderiales bacterium]